MCYDSIFFKKMWQQSGNKRSHLVFSNGPLAGLKENGVIVPGGVLFLDSASMPLMGAEPQGRH
jgi:hypothetical protein